MFFLISVFWSAVSASATDSCESFLRRSTPGPAFHELVSNSSPESQRFFHLLKSGLSARYENQEEVLEAVELLTVNPVMEDYFLSLNFDWKEVSWKVQRTFENGVLHYRVPSVHVKNQDVSVAMKTRSKSLNGGFSKVLVTLNQAIREDLLKNPEIKNVQITAVSVINPSLIELLTNIGYVIKRSPRPKPMVRMDFGGMEMPEVYDSSVQGHELVWPLQRISVASPF